MEKNLGINGIINVFFKRKQLNYNIQELKNKSIESNLSLIDYCYENNILNEKEFTEFLSKQLSLEFVDVSIIEEHEFPVLVGINDQLFSKYNFIPQDFTDKKISIITSNPLNEDLVKELKTNLKVGTVEVCLGLYSGIKDKLNKYLDQGHGLDDFDDDELDSIDISEPDEEEDEGNANDAPIVKYVNKMLFDAIKLNASDLHFEPYENEYRVRFRVDGVLREVSRPKIILKNHIAARLKVISGMDIAEKRKPQDGRIKIKYNKESIDFRVSSLPTLFGEKLVLRILDSKSAKMGIDFLGYEEDQKALFLEALGKPQGMILVTGPTGSGKTVSLYTGLNILNKAETNIATAEDPVEINLPGINQVGIQVKSGMTFANALRAFLRQDPDIIMVGEIRDLETAEISIKASQTGHMVMSTLHTNSASETITRLKNMGVASYNIASTLNLIIAQRLVRRLCPNCRVPLDINKEAMLEMGFTEEDVNQGFVIYEPNKEGCSKCTSGYKGRAGVYEVVKITKEVSKLILDNKDTLEMNAKFKELGFVDLRRAALLKVKAGLTSLAEVGRVTIE